MYNKSEMKDVASRMQSCILPLSTSIHKFEIGVLEILEEFHLIISIYSNPPAVTIMMSMLKDWNMVVKERNFRIKGQV